MDELAQQFGFSYSTVAADIDEKAFRADDPSDLVMTLAHAKAAAILSRWLDEDALPAQGGDFRILGRCFAILLHSVSRKRASHDAGTHKGCRLPDPLGGGGCAAEGWSSLGSVGVYCTVYQVASDRLHEGTIRGLLERLVGACWTRNSRRTRDICCRQSDGNTPSPMPGRVIRCRAAHNLRPGRAVRRQGAGET